MAKITRKEYRVGLRIARRLKFRSQALFAQYPDDVAWMKSEKWKPWLAENKRRKSRDEDIGCVFMLVFIIALIVLFIVAW